MEEMLAEVYVLFELYILICLFDSSVLSVSQNFNCILKLNPWVNIDYSTILYIGLTRRITFYASLNINTIVFG